MSLIDLDPRYHQYVVKIHEAHTRENYDLALHSLNTDDSLCTKLTPIGPDVINGGSGKWKCACGEQFPNSFRAANHMEVVVMRVQLRKNMERINAT